MDIEQILISFNKEEGTLMGFSTTFLEIDVEDKSVVDSYKCTHGSVTLDDNADIFEIKPFKQTYVERMDVTQTDQL